ncbi:hypothetical protein AK88_00053 [Plasmodium fragile]|uniref:Uncharacterized protein n=1 Tax=Plasmodium fragile TaxID=5857 RepID=A0A0D9QT18_PLAFR|nr:uncharacterized protein AK88_00053 [Plasmodium fragile]KJP90205.1 hypothetical protein AK88_00053 [Plasmodium fragile]
MKHLATTHLHVANRWGARRMLAKRAEVKKQTLFVAISTHYCSSIFDLIAKKKKESENRCKNGISVQEGTNIRDHELPPPQRDGSKRRTHTDDVNSLFSGAAKGEEKLVQEREAVIGEASSILDNELKWENRTLNQIHKSEQNDRAAEEEMYHNKVYLLRYIKQLQPNDDIAKYRLATKYVIKNVSKFYENELLFILKTFAKRRYKNLPLLQCTSEYLYWQCKMNKGSQKIISHYLHLCNLLNYVPTKKYIEAYLSVFNYCKEEVREDNFLFFNLIEEEINEKHKDLKHIILVLHFLHKGKIKNELYDTLLHMCCYYACQLSLRNTFLLLRIVLNEESGKHNWHYIKGLHRNMERHLDSMTQGDFATYVNTLLHNHVTLEENFFLFIRRFVEKHGVELSPSAVLSTLKLLKREKCKDTLILKKVLNVISKNFYHYTYADVVYVVKILTFLNHFDENFFFFLFEKFLPPMGTLPTGKLLSTWGDNTVESGSLPYKALHTYNEERLSPVQVNWTQVRKTQVGRVDKEEDVCVGPGNSFIPVAPQKKGPINELSHLPLHLYEERFKMKVEVCNIIEEKEQLGRDTHVSQISFCFKYVDMYVSFFVYLGTCGYRASDLLLRLSQMIRLCLLAGGGSLRDEGSTYIAAASPTTSSDHVTDETGRLRSNMSKRGEPQFVFLHDAIKKHKKQTNFALDGSSVAKLSGRENYLPPQDRCHKKSSPNVRRAGEGTSSGCQDSSSLNAVAASNPVATPIGGTKSCLRFLYKKSEKINLECLKKKKKKIQPTSHGEETNKDKMDISHLKYLNVEMFRRAKMVSPSEDPVCGAEVEEERGCYELTRRMKRNSVLSTHFGDVHPAAIRLHNRRLFQRHFDELHPSERYTEKVPTKPRVERSQKNGKDIHLKRYKEIRNLRNVCLRRYAQIFKQELEEAFEEVVVKRVHKVGEGSHADKTCSYKYPFDMVCDKNLIHVDDALFVDYTLCDNNRKVALRKHSHLVRKSNHMTRKEYSRGGEKKRNQEETGREKSPSENLLKWLYRYKNCLNLFTNEKKTYIHLIDSDIKHLGECVHKWYQLCGAKTTSSVEKQKGEAKAKMSLKNIAHITNACTNLYHFDKALIDVLLIHVSTLLHSFYSVQKSHEQKRVDSHGLYTCATARETTYECMYRFTNMWSFLTVCLQMNCFMKNVLSLDHRHETVTKLLHLHTSPYFILNMKHLTCVLNQADALSTQMERPYLIKKFLLHYLDISIFTSLFFSFCKNLFIMVTSNCVDVLMKDLQLFHTFTYSMLALQRDYLRQWISHSHGSYSTPIDGVPLGRNNEDTTFLQCLNFYVMFVCAASYRGLGREHRAHVGTAGGVTRGRSGGSADTCDILALALRYIKLWSCARDFFPAQNEKILLPPEKKRSEAKCDEDK